MCINSSSCISFLYAHVEICNNKLAAERHFDKRLEHSASLSKVNLQPQSWERENCPCSDNACKTSHTKCDAIYCTLHISTMAVPSTSHLTVCTTSSTDCRVKIHNPCTQTWSWDMGVSTDVEGQSHAFCTENCNNITFKWKSTSLGNNCWSSARSAKIWCYLDESLDYHAPQHPEIQHVVQQNPEQEPVGGNRSGSAPIHAAESGATLQTFNLKNLTVQINKTNLTSDALIQSKSCLCTKPEASLCCIPDLLKKDTCAHSLMSGHNTPDTDPACSILPLQCWYVWFCLAWNTHFRYFRCQDLSWFRALRYLSNRILRHTCLHSHFPSDLFRAEAQLELPMAIGSPGGTHVPSPLHQTSSQTDSRSMQQTPSHILTADTTHQGPQASNAKIAEAVNFTHLIGIRCRPTSRNPFPEFGCIAANSGLWKSFRRWEQSTACIAYNDYSIYTKDSSDLACLGFHWRVTVHACLMHISQGPSACKH